jgi:hypothetical protein
MRNEPIYGFRKPWDLNPWPIFFIDPKIRNENGVIHIPRKTIVQKMWGFFFND